VNDKDGGKHLEFQINKKGHWRRAIYDLRCEM